jgi:hypothetical protein
MKKKEISKEATPKHKIVADETYPFFYAYHNEAYIESHDKRSSVSLEESRMKYVLKNLSRKEIVVYKIDKEPKILNKHIESSIFYKIVGEDLRKPGFEKCDYGIYTEDDVLYLIELKSPERRYLKGLNQIQDTIDILIKRNKISVSKLNARIVLTKYPGSAINADERKAENMLIEKYKCDLKHGEKGILTEILS